MMTSIQAGWLGIRHLACRNGRRAFLATILSHLGAYASTEQQLWLEGVRRQLVRNA